MTGEERKRIGMLPNGGFSDPTKTRAVIEVKRAGNGDGFAISRGGVDYFSRLVREQRITQCNVRLIDRDTTVNGEQPLTTPAPKLEKAQPYASKFDNGPYWWLNADFTISGGGASAGERPDWIPDTDEAM